MMEYVAQSIWSVLAVIYKNRDLGMLMYTKFKTGMPPGTPQRFSVSPSNRQPSTGAGSNWPVSCALRTICHQAFCQQADNCPESISVVCLVGRSKVDNHGIGLPKKSSVPSRRREASCQAPSKDKTPQQDADQEEGQ